MSEGWYGLYGLGKMAWILGAFWYMYYRMDVSCVLALLFVVGTFFLASWGTMRAIRMEEEEEEGEGDW